MNQKVGLSFAGSDIRMGHCALRPERHRQLSSAGSVAKSPRPRPQPVGAADEQPAAAASGSIAAGNVRGESGRVSARSSARNNRSEKSSAATQSSASASGRVEVPTGFFKLLDLAPTLSEIQPPFGVLRAALTPESAFEATVSSVEDGLELLQTALPAAVAALEQRHSGPVWQALIKRAQQRGEAAVAAGDTVLPPKLSPRKLGTMYAGRDDNAAGSIVPLEMLPGGAAAADGLSERAAKLVLLLRIKLEDDGDLRQARKTLAMCQQFFTDLKLVGGDLGYESAYTTLMHLESNLL